MNGVRFRVMAFIGAERPQLGLARKAGRAVHARRFNALDALPHQEPFVHRRSVQLEFGHFSKSQWAAMAL